MLRNQVSCAVAVAGLLAATVPLRAAGAPNPEFTQRVNLEKIRLISVQNDGRFKTFDTLARSLLRHMSSDDTFQWEEGGKKTGAPQDAVFTYLDILFRPEAYRDARIVYIKEKVILDRLVPPVKDQLDKQTLDAIFKDKRVSLSFLMMPEVRAVLDDLNRDVMRTAKKVDVILNSTAYTDPRVLQRELRVLAPPDARSQQDRWYSIEDLLAAGMPQDSTHAGMMANRSLPGVTPELQRQLTGQWDSLRRAWMMQDAAGVNAALDSLADALPRVNPAVYPAGSKLALEHWYYKYNKMMWSWGVYFLALVFLLMGVVYRWPRAIKIGVVWFALAFALHTAACGIRWYLAGRIPNSNMFEAVTAAAWFGCGVALFFELGPYFFRFRIAWTLSWIMLAGGFVAWLGSLLILGVPVDKWQQWPGISIAALITFALGCMSLISLTVSRQMENLKGVPLFAASAVAMVALMCGQFLKNSLDSDIGRTMPVLNDLWLYVHTNMIIASYAVIGLAFMTASLYLVGRMLTVSWKQAKAAWLSILIPAFLIPLLALPDIVDRFMGLFRKGPSPNPSGTFLTVDQIFSAWAPFLIVLGMVAVAAIVRLFTQSFWKEAANRAGAAWAGLGSSDPGDRDAPLLAMAGGLPAIAASPAYPIAGTGGSTTGDRGRSGERVERHGVSLAKVFDGATILLLELSFIMLWTGIIMGAIWADHSWGRPWGWDPKEVFALNTWIIFLILVHVRLKVVDKELWTAVLAVIGTSVMMFNWVVVNFYIVGLHSYA